MAMTSSMRLSSSCLKTTSDVLIQAQVIGGEVTVLGFEREDFLGEILARCRRGRRVYLINVTALGMAWASAKRELMDRGVSGAREAGNSP